MTKTIIAIGLGLLVAMATPTTAVLAQSNGSGIPIPIILTGGIQGEKLRLLFMLDVRDPDAVCTVDGVVSIEILGSERETFIIGELALTQTEPSGMVEYVFDPGRKRIRQAVFARLFITHVAFSGLPPCTLYAKMETLDLVELAATLNGDGIVHIPGATGTGLFAVATSN